LLMSVVTVVDARVDAPARASIVTARRASATLLVVAVMYAAAAQGAYYWGQLRVTAILVFLALGVSAAGRRLSRREFDGPILAALALAAWYFAAAFVNKNVAGAGPAVLLLGAMAAVVLTVRRLGADERRFVLQGLLAVGVFIALSGWVGVAWRQAPHALEDGGLWRAASTITYANATGGVLAALAVFALGFFAARERYHLSILVTYVLVVGLFATASRAGLISFAIGVLILAVWTRGRVVFRNAPMFLGALVAFMALAPSMPVTHQPHPLLALIGLGVGAAISIMPVRLFAATTIVLLLAAMSIVVLQPHAIDSLTTLRHDRITMSSPDRVHETRAAFKLARDHPLVGAGPGNVDLTWSTTAPAQLTMHVSYAHNEYLQTLDEVGVVGLAILVIGCLTIGRAIGRSRRDPCCDIAFAGCVSALAVLAVHSSMDFLWHIPLVALIGAVFVGSLLSQPTQPSSFAYEQGATHDPQ
jgi:O-antigen ligase